MHHSKILLVAFLSFLLGCKRPAKSELFKVENNVAYYRDEAIPGCEAESFEAIDEHYAKDKNHVYYCDTYRSSQDYFTSKRNKIIILENANPSTFKVLTNGYARDKGHIFFEGKYFPVKDVNSFEILDYNFAKDNISGYYMQVEITGSSGASFIALDDRYAKDNLNVYYSNIDYSNTDETPSPKTWRLKDADASSFKVIDINYAADTQHVYYKMNILTDAVQHFQVLQRDYAKDNKQVFYMGKGVNGADASTFSVLDNSTDSADAKDKSSFYMQGKKIR